MDALFRCKLALSHHREQLHHDFTADGDIGRNLGRLRSLNYWGWYVAIQAKLGCGWHCAVHGTNQLGDWLCKEWQRWRYVRGRRINHLLPKLETY